MKFGSVFKKKFGKDPRELNISEIEKLAIKEVSFKEYGGGLVSNRGSIFKMKKYNIDILLDKALEKPLIDSLKI